MDYFGSAPDLPALEFVAKKVDGLWIPESTDPETGVVTPGRIAPQLKLSDGTEYVYVPWGFWQRPTGATTTDSMGNTVPVMANDGRFYFLLRWNGDPSTMPFGQAGGTMSTDPTTGITTITAGPVTMVSPPPSDCPVSF